MIVINLIFSAIADILRTKKAPVVRLGLSKYLVGINRFELLTTTYHYKRPLLLDDLLGWYRALFPNEYSGLYRIKAGIAHLWFVTIHLFDDGNGRLTRAITERVLTQSDDSSQRFYSISAQILKKLNDYYKILERTQKGDTDITDWLVWFLQTLEQALIAAQTTTDKIIHRASFWQTHRQHALNTRQVTMLNILLTDFYGKLTTKKWSVMTKCSIDTALRDMNDLIEKRGAAKVSGFGA